MKYLFLYLWVIALMISSQAQAVEPDLIAEDFDDVTAKEVSQLEGWQAFTGFRGVAPQARIQAKLGAEGSTSLTVGHTEVFRSDSWGLLKPLDKPVADGVLWLQCKYYPPETWQAGLFFDARSDREVVARVSAEKYQPSVPKSTEESGEESEPVFRAHAAWHHSYWRIYGTLPLKREWYLLTMRIDLDGKKYAAWVDDFVLGEELPLCSQKPITDIYLGLGGTLDDPARIDDLRISRTAPETPRMRELLPEKKPGLLFRMAVVGDPQLGFTDYQADVLRFQMAVEQINRSGAELTLVMGDMVHDADQEEAYADVKKISEQLSGPCYFARGNHDRLDLYQKYFHPQPDFSVTHKNWRFVFISAIGNQRGLTDEQLQFVEAEFKAANKAGETIVVGLHVSPWQDNEKGRGGYNQIGPGRDPLVELMDQYGVLFCLSGHYHRGVWHALMKNTHYMVFGGTAQVKQGHLGWCLFDVYEDRVEVFQKPIYYAYERPDAAAFYNFNYAVWTDYDEALEKYPYLQRGPAIIQRSGAKNAR